MGEKVMLTLTWLHLTDLHVGMKEHSWLLPGVEDRLFDDLKQFHQRTGPWDLGRRLPRRAEWARST